MNRSKRQPTVGLFGLFGMQNLGNECTLEAMLHNLRSRIPEANVYTIGYDPEDTRHRYGVESVSIESDYTASPEQEGNRGQRIKALSRIIRFFVRRLPAEVRGWLRARKMLKDTDLLLMTGTGMLTDYGASAVFGYAYDIAKWVLMARSTKCRVAFVSIGTGPLYRPLTCFLARRSLSLAHYRSYRDQFSKTTLGDLGLQNEGDRVVPDLAFSLPYGEKPPDSSQRRIVGLGLINYSHAPAGARPADQAYRHYLDTMVSFAGWLVDRGFAVRLLYGDIKYDAQVKRDFHETLQELQLQAMQHIIDDDMYSPRDLLNQVAETDLIVAARYHNQVIGLHLGKPVMSITYEPKSDALLAGFGLDAYRQDIHDLDVKGLKELFCQMDGAQSDLTRQIEEITETYREVLREQYDRIVDLAQLGDKNLREEQYVALPDSTQKA